MDRRFEARKRELLEDCEVSPEVFNGMLNRLEEFAEPYVQCLVRTEQKEHAKRIFRAYFRIFRERTPRRSHTDMIKNASGCRCFLVRRRGTTVP